MLLPPTTRPVGNSEILPTSHVLLVPQTLRFDARGRITIPASLREGLTDEVVAIRTPHGVVLHPIPEHVDLPVPADQASGEAAARDEA